MESYENHPWCPYSCQSGEEEEEEEEEEEDHHHDPHLAMARSKSPHHRSSFLVDELDMLMDKAATTIQATWRGYLTRKRLYSEHAAASVIQAAWRGFITREYLAMQQEQVPSWNVRGSRRRTPSPASSEDGRRSWGQPSMDKEKAAEVIQAHYRGYVTRRAISQCHQAATTIQAHWRGYRTRQELSQSPTYYTQRVTTVEGPSVAPYPRPHWQKVLVGEPDEWKAKAPTPLGGRRRERTQPPPQQKMCPQCGRYTTVRVLTGVGKGPPSKSDVDESEYEEALSPARRRAKHKRRQASRPKEGQNSSRNCPSGPCVSYSMCPQSYPGNCQTTGCQAQRPGCSPGRMYPRYATRPTRDISAVRSRSSTSIRHHRVRADGSADWLFENYCTRPLGEGQKRVFKTRKHMWQVAGAATRIQAFWRGCQARRELRQQQEAATRIQSAYRGYKTRAYLTEAGVLSEGDTD